MNKKWKHAFLTALFLASFGSNSALAQEQQTLDQIEARKKVERLIQSNPKMAANLNKLLNNPEIVKMAMGLLEGKWVPTSNLHSSGKSESRMYQLLTQYFPRIVYHQSENARPPELREEVPSKNYGVSSTPSEQSAELTFQQKVADTNPINPEMRAPGGVLVRNWIPSDLIDLVQDLQMPKHYNPDRPNLLNPYDPRRRPTVNLSAFYSRSENEAPKKEFMREKFATLKQYLRDGFTPPPGYTVSLDEKTNKFDISFDPKAREEFIYGKPMKAPVKDPAKTQNRNASITR